ncbi:n-carbamoyl-l-amino acid hydrolase [Pseudoneurospora amorphoporcata]|uniref:N-carbamoyl-l-amino acid hydrolase n=1 Tax=Pseudoneurospora amorphoporcata TaxID=241081 RepID=A0AAN6SHH4_9PEZI|nr:n-carbamoyl-l-amino acid hydrolase [Pseudoneurospora amorphoporcata]
MLAPVVCHNQLAKNIHDTCSQFGAAHRWGPGENETGMNRLALTDADKAVRDWFVKEAKGLGCEVEVDDMGNIWAIRGGVSDSRPTQDGSGKRLPPVIMGSHLDTQPRGGRYDGVLGVMAGLEALRVLKERDIKTWRPVGVVCWTNEEGARFPVSMVSSGVWAGEIPLGKAHSLKEVAGQEGKTMMEELERIGYLGDKKCSYEEMPMAAHFELHIEQGPVLEAKGKKVGVVRGSQAYKWFTVEVVGKEAHTGTTPYAQRADAFMAANSMIHYARWTGEEQDVLVSVGVFQVFPGSVNTIPGRVKFSLDIRSSSTDKLAQFVERHLRPKFDSIAKNVGANSQPCSVTWQEDTNSPAQLFDEGCCQAVKVSALSVLAAECQGNMEKAVGLVKYNMVSGAGHDSVHTAKRCPTSMIFVPSKGGLSHHPEEFTSEEDCVRGAQVLLESVLRFDREVWREDYERETAVE